ncbi:MAG: glycosyltransferase [Pseudomonadota bacterium]
MNFLFFNWMDIANPLAGGAEVYVQEIAKRLVSQGHKVTLFASAFKGGAAKEVIDGVNIYRSGNRYTVYFEARRFYKKYCHNKFDIIVDVINTIPFFTPFFAKNGEKIFVLIFQLAREFWFKATRFPVNYLGYYYFEDRWLSFYKNYPAFTISESSKNDLEQLGFINVSILPVGIKIRPVEVIPQKEKDPTLIFTGRLKSTKKPQDAIKAYHILKKEIPNLKLWIVGDGPLHDNLKKVADRGIKFWGFVSEDKKYELMSRAHIILVPGLREGWGLVVTEANAMGTPAVAYDVHGLRDSTRDNQTGLLCKENTPENLAKRALELFGDANLYSHIVSEAIDWSKTFSWDNVVFQFLKGIQIQQENTNNLLFQKYKSAKEYIVVVAEVNMPPLSRANLRVVKLAEALNQANYPAIMLTPSFTPLSRKSYIHNNFFLNQFWGCCKFMYSRFRAIIRLWHLIGSVLSIIYFRLRYSKISVIHAWNPLAGIAATIAGKILKVPVYIDFTDFYSDIAITDSPMMVNFLKLIERYVLKSARKIFVVSRRMRIELEGWGLKQEKIFIVPDGTDSNMFDYTISGEKIRNKYKLGDSPVIIYHGDIKEPDGVDLLYYAFVKIRERVQGTKLMILGGGGRYFKTIIQLGKDLGIHSDIIYTGWVPHKDVPEYIAAANVGAMPMRSTLNHECYLSFKLFEYWGMAKPVVVSMLKAISEIVVDQHNGLICDAKDIDKMVKAYSVLLTNQKMAEKMGMNGRCLVETSFNWERLMKMEVAAYQMNSSYEQSTQIN